jgi:hypothetical protein
MMLGVGAALPSAAGSVAGDGLAWPNGFRYRVTRAIAASLHGQPTGAVAWVFYRVAGAAMKTVANGGKVQNAAFLDHQFQSGGGLVLKHEVETYDGTAGVLNGWLRLQGFVAGQPLLLRHFYGHATLTAGQSDPAGCWAGCTLVVDFANGMDMSGNERSLTLSGVAAATLLDANAGDFA